MLGIDKMYNKSGLQCLRTTSKTKHIDMYIVNQVLFTVIILRHHSSQRRAAPTVTTRRSDYGKYLTEGKSHTAQSSFFKVLSLNLFPILLGNSLDQFCFLEEL